MTGVPGGDVTLHAAITDTLAAHPDYGWAGKTLVCIGIGCTWEEAADRPEFINPERVHRAHQADRVVERVAQVHDDERTAVLSYLDRVDNMEPSPRLREAVAQRRARLLGDGGTS